MKNNSNAKSKVTNVSLQLYETIQAYVNIIAHDQKSPLSCINMATRCCKDLLLKLDSSKCISKEQIQEFENWLTIINHSTVKMDTIRNNVLKNIKCMFDANSEANNLNLVECNIADSLNKEALKLLFIINDPKLVHIDLMYKFKYMGDKQSMDQVIHNLLQNAFYQIKKNGMGEIFISTESDDDLNILRIRDTAGGASPEIVKNMFNAGFTTKADGNGVGLDFCKRIMQLFGGDITANSVCGDYMEFLLSFPEI